MNIYDISKLAGVSTATVSRVINGFDNVKPATRDKVLSIMASQGYTPNAFARGLGLNTMNSIGIMCADSSDMYLAKAVYYIERNLREEGYHCILTCTGYNRDSQKEALSSLLSQHVDCIILVGSTFIDKDNKKNKYIYDASDSIPIMLLNASLEHKGIYSILCDDSAAMQEATLNLLDNGRKDILYLFNSYSYSAEKKKSGYRSAFELRKMNCDERYIHYFNGSSQDIEGVYNFISGLAEKGLHFDAVLASDDFLAVGAIKYAIRNGIKIPEDLSIIGYNNSVLTNCCEPELSSVDNHLEVLCQNLVRICIGTLSGQSMAQQTVFRGELVHRKTTINKSNDREE
ncbi:MAG: LacI family DNA-binding transcriptional regulator [Eubacterium sp.]|nr:LacI family DNA-binding transcriptional regulator [Eubacterium sp.]